MRRGARVAMLVAFILSSTSCGEEGSADEPDESSNEEEASLDESSEDEETNASGAPDGGSSGRPRMDAGNGRVDAGSANPPIGDARTETSPPNSRPEGGAGRSDAGMSPMDSSTEEPTQNGFPPAGDTASEGPYATSLVNDTGPDGFYTVHRPSELAPDGALHPIVAWGNGGATTPDWYPQLPHLASHGFVVIASNNPLVTGADVRNGIDWLIEQNDDPSSEFYQKLDTDNVAGVGYSLGGLANLEIADDPRLVTIVIFSGANTNESARAQNMPKLHTPIAYLCTDDADSKGNCANDYNEVTVPAFFGVVVGTNHFSVFADAAAVTELNKAATAWLRWHQMGEESHKAMFVGDDCGLCTDPTWSVEPQKNLN